MPSGFPVACTASIRSRIFFSIPGLASEKYSPWNRKGEAWVINSDGVYILPAEELIRNGEGMKPLRYNVGNGLPCTVTANSYSELTESGDLYLSGNTGVAKVNMEETDDSLVDLKADVPYLYVDGRRMYPDGEGNYTVPSGTRRLTVCGYVFNYE